ncbi:hypothetical protein [Streptomyces sp. FH025]|uniref:hypothetical protein n=1 Tax=Streptomyces sp. FH025 TaxID=2815937 RepID=UPI001A9DD5AD|nr:hypothetical protein [Streptomyces sp. FH025]MBO1420405.1 hypothetical protein [Streptomyces sp. FH025]
MERINTRLRADGFEEFTPREPEHYWWGPIPLAFDVPDDEAIRDLEQQIDLLVTSLATIEVPS